MTLPFENDTGPVIKRLASRSIQQTAAQPVCDRNDCSGSRPDGSDFLRRSGK